MLYMCCIYVHTHGVLSNFIVNIQQITNFQYTCNHHSLIIHTLLVPFIINTGINLFFVLGIVITSNRMDDASVASMESLHNILTLHVTYRLGYIYIPMMT